MALSKKTYLTVTEISAKTIQGTHYSQQPIEVSIKLDNILKNKKKKITIMKEN